MAWAKNGTPDTLGSAGDTLSISDLTAKIFNFILEHTICSSTVTPQVRVGSSSLDSGTNYANRYSTNGGTDATGTSDSKIEMNLGGATTTYFDIIYGINISAEEKLFIGFAIYQGTAGATFAPPRREFVSKWANSNQFDNVGDINGGAGDFDTGSNLSVLTGDETETVTLQDGTIFEETDTNKAYIWSSSSKTWTQL